MEARTKTVFFARTLAEALSPLATVPGIRVIAGCTLARTLPSVSVSVRSIDELQMIDRRERFIDLGSAVTLSKILAIGQKRLPAALFDAIQTTATPFIRNIATIGGNLIGTTERRRSIFAPLFALDARLEFRGDKEMRVIPITQFDTAPTGMLLTSIRVPLEEWEISVFRRLGPTALYTGKSVCFTFLARAQKSILSDARIVYSGKKTFRCKAVENALVGTRLPLSAKTIQGILASATVSAHVADDADSEFEHTLARTQYLHLLEGALEQLSR